MDRQCAVAARLVNNNIVPYGTIMDEVCLHRAASRREARRHDRREVMLEVARQSFLENGYASTTMSSIASTLGGSKGTLWNYFPSKEALFEAVIDQATTAYRARLSEILDPGGDFFTTLRQSCIGILEKIFSPQAVNLYRLVIAESGRFPEMGVIFYKRGPRKTWELLADFLSGAMDRGQMRRADPVETARMLVSLCMSAHHQQLLTGVIDSVAPDVIEQDVDHALAFFMQAHMPQQA